MSGPVKGFWNPSGGEVFSRIELVERGKLKNAALGHKSLSASAAFFWVFGGYLLSWGQMQLFAITDKLLPNQPFQMICTQGFIDTPM